MIKRESSLDSKVISREFAKDIRDLEEKISGYITKIQILC